MYFYIQGWKFSLNILSWLLIKFILNGLEVKLITFTKIKHLVVNFLCCYWIYDRERWHHNIISTSVLWISYNGKFLLMAKFCGVSSKSFKRTFHGWFKIYACALARPHPPLSIIIAIANNWKFCGSHFHDDQPIHENHEVLHHVKISQYRRLGFDCEILMIVNYEYLWISQSKESQSILECVTVGRRTDFDCVV